MNETQTTEPIRPTKKQKELLGFIETFTLEHGYSPSYREIMNGLQYNSVATVALHVGNLIKRGHIVKRGRSARSLEVVQPSTEVSKVALATNQVRSADEKWLVGQVERLLGEADSTAGNETLLDDISVVLAAMRILQLDGAVQSLTPRLQQLRLRNQAE